MTVFRVNKSRDYTVMSNHHLRDKGLSFKAKGLLSMMLSLPDDWDYSIAGLAAISKEGTSAVKSTLGELREAGYMTITKLYPNQTQSGRIEYIYDIWESPCGEKQGASGQGIENQSLEGQPVENRGQLNTDNKKMEEPSTEKQVKAPADSIRDYTQNSELRDALAAFVEMRRKIRAPMTDRAISLLFKNLDNLTRNDEEKVAILDQSIANSWRGIFPLKEQPTRKGVRDATPYDNLW